MATSTTGIYQYDPKDPFQQWLLTQPGYRTAVMGPSDDRYTGIVSPNGDRITSDAIQPLIEKYNAWQNPTLDAQGQSVHGTEIMPFSSQLKVGEGGDWLTGGQQYFDLNGQQMTRLGGGYDTWGVDSPTDIRGAVQYDPTYGYYVPKAIDDKYQEYRASQLDNGTLGGVLALPDIFNPSLEDFYAPGITEGSGAPGVTDIAALGPGAYNEDLRDTGQDLAKLYGLYMGGQALLGQLGGEGPVLEGLGSGTTGGGAAGVGGTGGAETGGFNFLTANDAAVNGINFLPANDAAVAAGAGGAGGSVIPPLAEITTGVGAGSAGIGELGLGLPALEGITTGVGAGSAGIGSLGSLGGAAGPAVTTPSLPGISDIADAAGGLLGGGGAGTGGGFSLSSLPDWLNPLAQTLVGYLGADALGDDFGEMADWAKSLGQPYRDYAGQLMDPNFDLFAQGSAFGNAADRAADRSARAYGAQYGDPSGSPSAQGEIYKDVLSDVYIPTFENQQKLALAGSGLGLPLAGDSMKSEALAKAGRYDAIGQGLSGLLNPQPSNMDWFNLAQNATGGGSSGNQFSISDIFNLFGGNGTQQNQNNGFAGFPTNFTPDFSSPDWSW